VLVLFLGLLAYAICDAGDSRAKTAVVGRIMFAMGLLAWLIANGSKVAGS